MLFTYYIQSGNNELLGVLVGGTVLIVVYIGVFGLNLITSQITRIAHKPRELFHEYLLHNTVTFNQKIRIIAFIESLSGPDIEFYCLDLFPMTNFEFYLYITNCVKIYFLCHSVFALFL